MTILKTCQYLILIVHVIDTHCIVGIQCRYRIGSRWFSEGQDPMAGVEQSEIHPNDQL